MPIGTPNFVTAIAVLTLKLWLLPRALSMPLFALYIAASCITTSAYLMGWERMEAAWMPTVAILGIAAAIECTGWTLGLQSDEERTAVSKWCVLLGFVLVATAMINSPVAYPKYAPLVYEVRLYSMLFAVGYLAALVGYCFAVSVGIPRFVVHASILLLRIATMGALLLVRDRMAWFSADLIGGAVNALTLGTWLILLPRRISVKPAIQRLHN